jgi:parallel beta-helix repeat protein
MALLRWSWVAALVAGVGTLALAVSASASLCGGSVPCTCGDTVVADAKLAYDIGTCSTTGLTVVSGIVLDCAGHSITGDDSSNAKFGVHVDGAVGATVQRCRVAGFRRGLRINGGSANSLINNQTFVSETVGDETVYYANKYGIDLAGDTFGNLLKRNSVQHNRDEGVHVGGSNDNRFIGNEVARNKREGLYLLNSHHNLFFHNVAHRNEAAGIFVKHSSNNVFKRNIVRDGALHVRGDSTGNRFRENYLKNNGYVFEAYEEPTGWTYPHDNHMRGDCIRRTQVCFRFRGAYDNVASATRPGIDCLPPDGEAVTEEPMGGLTPSGNEIELAAPCNDDPAWTR